MILLTVCLMIATYLRWFQLNFFIGRFRFTHWLVWIGTLYIVFVTPAYYVLKRRYTGRVSALVKVHMFGNLFSFMLISIHFAQQIGRPAQFYPDLGTGLALYIVMFILVITGFFHRFRIVKSIRPHLNRFTHVSITMSFYIIIIVHILQGLNIF
jgi:hypothetical protein